MANPRDIELMEQHDGEASPLGTYAPAEAAKIKGLRAVSTVVRDHLEAPIDAAPDFGDAMWADMGAQLDAIDANRAAPPTRHSRTSASLAASTPGIWGMLGRHRGYVATALISAGVVAGVALLMRPTPASSPSGSAIAVLPSHVEAPAPNPTTNPTTNPAGNPDIMPANLPAKPTEVEDLDVPDGTGTVMTISDDDGETAVIFISPTDMEGL